MPALLAFLSILTTTVNFVVSVEVQFYPRYRTYYSLFNDGGVVGLVGPRALPESSSRLGQWGH